MEMIATAPVMTMPPSSSSYTPAPRKLRSLLKRRSSRKLSPDTNTNTISEVLTPTTNILSTDACVVVSNTTALGTTVRAPRPSTTALLPFVPLTPIMASPRLTPDLGSGPGPAALAHVDSELAASHNELGPTVVIPDSITIQSPSCDDLHIPDVVRLPDSEGDGVLSAAGPLPPPSWTSTPPTPPLKGIASCSSRSPSRGPSPTRTRKTSRSRVSHVRPASVAVFPAYRPPSPPPLCLFEDATPSPSAPSIAGAPRSSSANVTRSSSFDDVRSADVKRRQSLPRNFGKPPQFSPAAANAEAGSSRDSETERGRERERDGVLPPSLSRHSGLRRGRNSDKSPLGASVVSRENSVGSARCRPKFMLDDDDASEGENDGEDGETARTEHEVASESVEDDTTKMSGSQRELHTERVRVGMKRFHTLMELLATEVGYLMDLRVLVTIYLAHLPSLNTSNSSAGLTRPSPSALSISNLSRSRPFPSSRSSALPSSVGPPMSDCPSAYFDKYAETSVERDPEKGKGDRDKQAKRALFSDADLQIIRRNADQLLQLHQRFLGILREKLEPLGYGAAFADPSAGNDEEHVLEDVAEKLEAVDEAVEVVAEAFSDQASSFEIYESFCPWHNEAASLLRTVQERYPVEWDAYEQRCSLRVAHEFELATQLMSHTSSPPDASAPPPPPPPTVSMLRKRRHSTSSVALFSPVTVPGPVPASSSNLNVMSPNKSDPAATTAATGHKRKGSSASGSGQAGKLKFLDYLIKPVQRLCKYPLLLDQLRAKRKQPANDDSSERSTIENACGAIRAIVAQVDKASERQAHQLKSALIASRLVTNAGSSSSSSAEGSDEKPAHITADFMRSLGACLLAGALDVVYPQSSGGLRTKYLAAFLYMGGYFVLAKVPKGGKVFEPRHWFSLGGFELVDEEEEDAALPYAFHLFCAGYHLHLAAACQLEKTIWMAAIQDALSVHPPDWTNVPTANIPADDRPPTSATEENAPDWMTPLPTILSMSELEASEIQAPMFPSPSPRKLTKTISKADGISLRQELQFTALNRRTSTSSVKAFFAPLSFDSRITRPSSQIRQQVDQGLHDVFSETFITVRSQAQMRDEELFQPRSNRKPGNMSRSNSGLSISGAFATRRRHDSIVLASRDRRKGSLDGIPDVTSDPETGQKTTPVALSKRSKSAAAKRRGKLPLSVVPSQSSYADDVPLVQSPEGSVEAPSPLTQCSSTSSSNAGSTLPSPMDLSIPLPMPSPVPLTMRASDSRYRPTRTRSMVDNVKHFFHSRSISPTPSQHEESPKIAVVSLDVEADTPGGLVQWWRRGSLRRRAQSSPEMPMDESSPGTPAESSEDSHLSSKSSPNGHSTSSAVPSPEPSSAHPPPFVAPRRVAFSDATPIRRRSLFASSSRSDFKSSLSTDAALSRGKTLKNVFLFQRSNSYTRTTNLDS